MNEPSEKFPLILCPLQSRDQAPVECGRDLCALWDDVLRCCTLRLIGPALYDLARHTIGPTIL